MTLRPQDIEGSQYAVRSQLEMGEGNGRQEREGEEKERRKGDRAPEESRGGRRWEMEDCGLSELSTTRNDVRLLWVSQGSLSE